MFKFLQKLFDENKGILNKTLPLVKKINELESGFEKKSDEDLFNKTEEFKKRINDGETLDDILIEAFAVVREVSKRNTGLRPYDVQLMGAILLHWGFAAEMKTGEGKTLVATLAVYLNALENKGVHVVTVNDYLARRDAVWVGQIYSKLGLSIGIINSNNSSYLYDNSFKDEKDEERDEKGNYKIIYEFLRPIENRKESYDADITYGTNSEFGFDYLRDNITQDKKGLRQRKLNYAIVDEIDSILIDEARVPLIISAPKSEDKNIYATFSRIASELELGSDFDIDEKSKTVLIRKEGIKKVELILKINNLYAAENIALIDSLETALKAKSLYKKEKEYVIKDGQVVIIDEFTGRMQDGRRWSDGLHQAIEAKENVEIKEESRTYASVTYQNYFKMYKKLSGMTGTAETSKEEFFKVYNLDVVVVPTNRLIVRIDQKDFIFAKEIGKFTAITKKIKELQKKGQPILVGTASVERSEMLSEFLIKEKVKHSVLNAKNHESEGEIIASAGIKGAVTIATNMAGRGVDIKLGGPDATEDERNEILELGGLYVLGTERHESRRTDNQLRGRSGRQGDPGETQFFISLEDHLMRVFGNQDFLKMILAKKMELEDGEDIPIKSRMMSKTVESAQTKLEGMHFDGRKNVLEYDNVLDIQRKSVYKKRKSILLSEKDEIYKIFRNDFSEDEKFLNLIEKKKEEFGEKEFFNFLRRKYLEIYDEQWIDHLTVMEYLKRSVLMQAYGQKDPLIEYKKEAKVYFDDFYVDIYNNLKKFLTYLDVKYLFKVADVKSKIEKQSETAIANSGKSEDGKGKTMVKNSEDKVGRNDICPCGSSKKYKKCCGKDK